MIRPAARIESANWRQSASPSACPLLSYGYFWCIFLGWNFPWFSSQNVIFPMNQLIFSQAKPNQTWFAENKATDVVCWFSRLMLPVDSISTSWTSYREATLPGMRYTYQIWMAYQIWYIGKWLEHHMWMCSSPMFIWNLDGIWLDKWLDDERTHQVDSATAVRVVSWLPNWFLQGEAPTGAPTISCSWNRRNVLPMSDRSWSSGKQIANLKMAYRNSGFAHWTWWFSSSLCKRVPVVKFLVILLNSKLESQLPQLFFVALADFPMKHTVISSSKHRTGPARWHPRILHLGIHTGLHV